MQAGDAGGLFENETAGLGLGVDDLADLALAEGKELRIGSRTLTRVDAAEVKERIAFWQRDVNRLSGQSRRFRRVVPID